MEIVKAKNLVAGMVATPSTNIHGFSASPIIAVELTETQVKITYKKRNGHKGGVIVGKDHAFTITDSFDLVPANLFA